MNSMIKILDMIYNPTRQSHDHLVFIMRISVPWKMVLNEMGLRDFLQNNSCINTPGYLRAVVNRKEMVYFFKGLYIDILHRTTNYSDWLAWLPRIHRNWPNGVFSQVGKVAEAGDEIYITWIDLLQKSHNAPVPYPTMHHFVTEMCTCVHISVTNWCIVGYLLDALWDLWDGSIHVEYICDKQISLGAFIMQ